MKTISLAAAMVLAAGAVNAQPACVNVPGGLASIPECPSTFTDPATTYPYDTYQQCHFESPYKWYCTDQGETAMWNREIRYQMLLNSRLDFWQKCAANLKCWRWLAPLQ